MFCLTEPTDAAWARQAVSDLGAVLVDHAHCEMKAASNALSLAARHPSDARIVLALTALAREELDHFDRVLALLTEQGLVLANPPVDNYAASLRRAAHDAKLSVPPLCRRLLIGAIIEARSSERFKLLLPVLPEAGAAHLVPFYEELFECEARHYRTYVDLATLAADGDSAAVREALGKLAEAEGRIVRELAQSEARAAVHG
jgi:tRNA 2-(methylsulfanyl)-N6-isopentenyladenosine37 hydroxylase